MKKEELRQIIREEIQQLHQESKSVPNKTVFNWIQSFNNAAVEGINDGHITFIASNFAAKGIKRVLDKYDIQLKKLGGVRYGIKLADKRKFAWNESKGNIKKL